MQENLGGIKRPDYLWKEKMRELKNVTSAKAVDSAVRKALKQIAEYPGGIILDCTSITIDADALRQAIDYRMKRSGKGVVDVLVIERDELIHAVRYKKGEALTLRQKGQRSASP